MSDKKETLVVPVYPNNIEKKSQEETIDDDEDDDVKQVVAPASDTPDLLPFPILKQIAFEARKKSLTINLGESEGKIKLEHFYSHVTSASSLPSNTTSTTATSTTVTSTSTSNSKSCNISQQPNELDLQNNKEKLVISSKMDEKKIFYHDNVNNLYSSSDDDSEVEIFEKKINQPEQIFKKCSIRKTNLNDESKFTDEIKDQNNNKNNDNENDEVQYGDYEVEIEDDDEEEEEEEEVPDYAKGKEEEDEEKEKEDDDDDDDDDVWFDYDEYKPTRKDIYKRRATPFHHNIPFKNKRTLSTIREEKTPKVVEKKEVEDDDEKEKEKEKEDEKSKSGIKHLSMKRKDGSSSFKRSRSVRFSKKKSLRRYNPASNSIASIEPSTSTTKSVASIEGKMSTFYGSPSRIGKDKQFRHTVSSSNNIRSCPISQDERIKMRSKSLRYAPSNPHLLYPSQVSSHFKNTPFSVDRRATHQIYARRKSLLHTIFGQAGHRRFSEDLSPVISPDVETSNTYLPHDGSLKEVTCQSDTEKRSSGSSSSGGGGGSGGDHPDGGDGDGHRGEDSYIDTSNAFKAKSYAIILGSQETTRVIFYQVFIPFLIAGFDNVGAGIILDYVQHWDVFKIIPELFILVASFLGLKGNLEMTLAARLATMANIGELDKPSSRWKIAIGNLALVQGQAIVVALLASLIAIFVNYFKEPDYDFDDSFLICVTGLVTASITGLAMATLMVTATVVARKVGINPDNVSALIASIMGDISAVTLLAVSAKVFHDARSHINYYAPVIILFYLVVLVVSLIVARKNSYTHDVVGTGWLPIIVAMIISSAAGFVFDVAVGFFETIAVVQPIINGVGGNLIAVQASRISTYFHLRSPMGLLPSEDEDDSTYSHTCSSPLTAFMGQRKFIISFSAFYFNFFTLFYPFVFLLFALYIFHFKKTTHLSSLATIIFLCQMKLQFFL